MPKPVSTSPIANTGENWKIAEPRIELFEMFGWSLLERMMLAALPNVSVLVTGAGEVKRELDWA